jgi:hypothetical protein
VHDHGRLRPRTAVVAVVLVAALVAAGLVVRHSRGDGRALEGVPPAGSSAAPKVGVFRGTSRSEVRTYEQWLGRPMDYVDRLLHARHLAADRRPGACC